MFVYWGKHKGAIFHASAQGPKIPRSDPRKRRKHLNAQSQKEKSPFCRTSSRSLTLMSSCPPDLCADPTFLAMLLSIPNPAAVVKDIVKSSIFAKKCIESQAKALLLCLEGAPSISFHSWRVCGKFRNVCIIRIRGGNRVVICPALC